MRKVGNSKAVKRLAGKSFASNRTRNLVAAAAIALTAMLFTAVFTIGLGMIESAQDSLMRQAGGDAHGAIKHLTQTQYDRLKTHPSIKECGRDISVSYHVENPEFLKRSVEMHFVDPAFYPHWFIEILDGKKPEKADEILMDEVSLEKLGVPAKAGEKVTLTFRLHADAEELIQRTFTVSGVIRSSDLTKVGFVFVTEAYLEAYADEIFANAGSIYDGVGEISMHVIFASASHIQEKLYRVITDCGFSVEEGAKNGIESNANWAYLSGGAQADPYTVAGMAAALALILLTGYLIIYNIFQISVMNEIRFYGLLKTIGTTGRQIRKILNIQAWKLCVCGIPIGLLLGFLGGKVLLPVLLTPGKDPSVKLISISPRPWIFVGAALFAMMTVWIAKWKPARIAAKVSPIEALRYTDQSSGRKKEKHTMHGGKMTRMALSNLGRSRIRTAVVICSLSLSLILLNSVYTIVHSIDKARFLSKMILCEDIIGNAALWNYQYRPFDAEAAEEVALSERFVDACEKQESFLAGGRIYLAYKTVQLSEDAWEIPSYIQTDEEGAPVFATPEGMERYDGYEQGGYYVAFYGIEPFVLEKMEIVEGESEKERIREKLETGDYLVYAADVDDNNRVIEKEVKHHAGDKVTLKYEDGTQKEYEILSVVKRHMMSLTNKMSSHFSYYTMAETFKEHCSEKYLMSYLMDTKEGMAEEMEQFLKSYTTEIEPVMSYESRTSYEDSYQQLAGMIVLVGSVLTAVIGIIGILNFVNTVLTGMITRKREFAMMEAIGMTKRQIVRMLMTEGGLYAAGTILCTLIFSTVFSLTAIRGISGGIWFIRYHFTLLPLAAASPLLVLFGAFVPKAVYALRKKESIMEQIRE